MKKFYERYWRGSHYNELTNDLKNDFIYKWPILERLIPREPIRIVDFGCGNGMVLRNLRKLTPKSNFIGIDISAAAIKQAHQKNTDVKFFRVDDGDDIPLKSNSIDYILAGDVIEHVYDTESMFKEFYRILKKNGQILITTPYYGLIKNILIVLINFDLVFDPKGPHIRFFTKKSLTVSLMEVGFSIKKFGYFGRFFPISNAMYIMAQK